MPAEQNRSAAKRRGNNPPEQPQARSNKRRMPEDSSTHGYNTRKSKHGAVGNAEPESLAYEVEELKAKLSILQKDVDLKASTIKRLKTEAKDKDEAIEKARAKIAEMKEHRIKTYNIYDSKWHLIDGWADLAKSELREAWKSVGFCIELLTNNYFNDLPFRIPDEAAQNSMILKACPNLDRITFAQSEPHGTSMKSRFLRGLLWQAIYEAILVKPLCVYHQKAGEAAYEVLEAARASFSFDEEDLKRSGPGDSQDIQRHFPMESACRNEHFYCCPAYDLRVKQHGGKSRAC